MNKLLSLRKKPHLVCLKGINYSMLSKNSVVIRAMQYGSLNNNEIESIRRLIRRKIKRSGQLSIRAYGYLPLLKKPAEVRMGKGKGNKLRYKIFPVRPGQILVQLEKISVDIALDVLKLCLNKLSVRAYVEVI
jgi:large subunit ribosomal protein L16